jgi:hypothetical protein
MTSRFRLLAAACAAVLALILGWITALPRSDDGPQGRRTGFSAPQVTGSEDVDRYVQEIFSSELFPAAQLRDETLREEESGPLTMQELEETLRDPSLSAFVKRGDAWSIILYGVGEGAQTREVGDQLADGWIIQNIDATWVLLTKGEESRRIEVFKAEPDTQ